MLGGHCAGRRGGDNAKGKLRLDDLATDFADSAIRSHRTAVIERLDSGEMLPGESRVRRNRTFRP